MELIKMSDYVGLECDPKCLEVGEMEGSLTKIHDYANLLKAPPSLGQFVPCDLEGNVLEKPEQTMMQGNGIVYYSAEYWEFEQYKEAEERVIFKGCALVDAGTYKVVMFENKEICIEVEGGYNFWNRETLEDLTHLGLILKQKTI